MIVFKFSLLSDQKNNFLLLDIFKTIKNYKVSSRDGSYTILFEKLREWD